ncbi:hypothetical protein [Segatella copri]|uniref:hypothetical protein n=1 Tax=Segatella copri TaxID=165179 RepID=UPI0020CF4411|nr:hypothetical protein [Segatella copri]MCP9551360.1 hypothetical protein [Segatella copri]MCP9581146.1 hypothetical protein [Segatella copri]MCP9583905.1 hypothetical protein [Segatella copri]
MACILNDKPVCSPVSPCYIYHIPNRPAWMNWPISINEVNNNAAVRDYNNPSCTDAYK